MAKNEILSGKNLMIFGVLFVALLFLLHGTGSRSTLQVQDGCSTNGNFCLGTGELWKCDAKTDGTHVASQIEVCDDGYICDSRSGSCEAKIDCAETTVPIWYRTGDDCVFNEMGHGCLDPMGDGVTTFASEEACEEVVIDSKAGFLNIVPPEGSNGYYIFAAIAAAGILGAYLYFRGSKKK